MRKQSWENTQNILCLRPDNLGDVLMTTPALRALKESNPDRKITLLTSKSGSLITRFIPEIDETIVFDVPWVQSKKQYESSQEMLDFIDLLKKRNFDGAIIFTAFSQNPLPSALISFLADIPLRLAHCHENPYQLLTDWIPDPEPKMFVRHEVERQLDLVAHIGASTKNTRLSLTIPSKTKAEVIRILTKSNVDPLKPWLTLHPGASSPKRLYNPQGYIEAGKKLIDVTGYQILVTGTGEEQKIADSITKGIGNGAVSVANKLSMEQFIGLIENSALLISNNTGPVHIAAAVGTPIVDLYALTNPQHTPWKVPNRVLYFPVAKELAKNLVLPIPPKKGKEITSPMDIVTAAKELLQDCSPELQASVSL